MICFIVLGKTSYTFILTLTILIKYYRNLGEKFDRNSYSLNLIDSDRYEDILLWLIKCFTATSGQFGRVTKIWNYNQYEHTAAMLMRAYKEKQKWDAYISVYVDNLAADL